MFCQGDIFNHPITTPVGVTRIYTLFIAEEGVKWLAANEFCNKIVKTTFDKID